MTATPPPVQIHVLVVEDLPADAELMIAELRRSGYAPVWTRVETEPEYLAGLRPDLDVILADYTLPQFSAPRALELLNQRRVDTPLIVVTGAVGEEYTVECVKKGAVDYIFKDRLGRLGLTVAHALAERALRAEQRNTEEALRTTEAMFRTLVENVSDVVALLDGQGIIRYVSPASVRMTGYTERELVGADVFVHVHPDDRTAAVATVQHATNAAVAPGAVEFRFQTKDGAWRTLEAVGTRLEVGQQAPMCVMVMRDITERRRLEEQLRQAQKMEAIGRLAGGIAHDFNNLLTAILGYSEMLLADMGSKDPRLADIEEIAAAGRRAATLTRQLLWISRREMPEPQVVDLNATVTEANGILQRLIREDITLTTTLDPSLRPVRTDPGQIEQVLFNLVVNATDAMPEGGRLNIETSNVTFGEGLRLRDAMLPRGEYVRLIVRDTGCGMSDDVKGHLFEPFFTTKKRGEGTGLGLATVYGIVTQSGGGIEVASELGQGTTMSIYLPQVTGSQLEASHLQPAQSLGSTRGTETILVVEDDVRVRKLACSALKREGYTLLEASSADEARQRAANLKGRLDLVLTDVVMPGDSGVVVAEDLQRARPALKVLFMSGYRDEAMSQRLAPWGAGRLLKKPFRPNELKTIVRAVLDEPGEAGVSVGDIHAGV